MATFRRTVGVAGCALLGAMALAAHGSGAATTQQPRGTIDGAALFRAHCASCHGTSGRGDGPVAASMRKPPTNLTRFSQENGGVFPEARLRRIIDGREVESHGTREMPVWGIALRQSPEGPADATVEARIAALVKHIQSIQERMARAHRE